MRAPAVTAIGLTLFFVGALISHLPAHNHALGFPCAYLLFAAASLGLYSAK
jgi:hypothetical protein